MSKEVYWGLIHGEGDIHCECDQCGEEHDYSFEDGDVDFRDCQEELKMMGWISRKIDGEWCDFCCKECLDKFIRSRQ